MGQLDSGNLYMWDGWIVGTFICGAVGYWEPLYVGQLDSGNFYMWDGWIVGTFICGTVG